MAAPHVAIGRCLVTGTSGNLGAYVVDRLRDAGVTPIAWRGPSRHTLPAPYDAAVPVELGDPDQVRRRFLEAAPDCVIHCAGVTSIASAFADPVAAWRANDAATRTLAELAFSRGLRFLYTSTDLVFDGTAAPYEESATPAPLSVYGKTKLGGESWVRAGSTGLVVRFGLLYGPTRVRRPTFFDGLLEALAARREVVLFEDEWRAPLSLDAAAAALVELALSGGGRGGLELPTPSLHVCGPERMSRLEMGRRVARHLGYDDACLVAASRVTARAPEPRPRDTSFDCRLWRKLGPTAPWPSLEEGLAGMGLAP